MTPTATRIAFAAFFFAALAVVAAASFDLNSPLAHHVAGLFQTLGPVVAQMALGVAALSNGHRLLPLYAFLGGANTMHRKMAASPEGVCWPTVAAGGLACCAWFYFVYHARVFCFGMTLTYLNSSPGMKPCVTCTKCGRCCFSASTSLARPIVVVLTSCFGATLIMHHVATLSPVTIPFAASRIVFIALVLAGCWRQGMELSKPSTVVGAKLASWMCANYRPEFRLEEALKDVLERKKRLMRLRRSAAARSLLRFNAL
jgi:hypothetical protein